MTTTSKPTIFITGATGLIGGTFLHLMLSRDYLDKFTISALVRHPEDAETMRQLGIRPVVGTLDDSVLLKEESAAASVVFNTADCDHVDSARAIVRGLLQRANETGSKPILIHTSGAGVLSTNSTGTGISPEEDKGATMWDDQDALAHATIPPFAPHRFVDLEVFAGAETRLIKTYLVVPPTVFGRGLGAFAEKRMSIQIPRLVQQSLMSRRALYVGSGENQWTNVHVVDLAELYLLILDGALKNTAPEGAEGLYYPSTEYFPWIAVADRIAQILHAKGLIARPNATSGLREGWFWGSNVRTKSTNGQKIGWLPTLGGNDQMLADVEWDVELVLRMFALSR